MDSFEVWFWVWVLVAIFLFMIDEKLCGCVALVIANMWLIGSKVVKELRRR